MGVEILFPVARVIQNIHYLQNMMVLYLYIL
jgi:hypothetical protein